MPRAPLEKQSATYALPSLLEIVFKKSKRTRERGYIPHGVFVHDRNRVLPLPLLLAQESTRLFSS
jgi:hypothetical protein